MYRALTADFLADILPSRLHRVEIATLPMPGNLRSRIEELGVTRLWELFALTQEDLLGQGCWTEPATLELSAWLVDYHVVMPRTRLDLQEEVPYYVPFLTHEELYLGIEVLQSLASTSRSPLFNHDLGGEVRTLQSLGVDLACEVSHYPKKAGQNLLALFRARFLPVCKSWQYCTTCCMVASRLRAAFFLRNILDAH